MKTYGRLLFLLSAMLFLSKPALAGDSATLVFKSGIKVLVDNGYSEIASAFKRLNDKSSDHQIVEMSVGGGTFLLNVSEVVVVCRDRCQGMSVQDMRDPKRGQR